MRTLSNTTQLFNSDLLSKKLCNFYINITAPTLEYLQCFCPSNLMCEPDIYECKCGDDNKIMDALQMMLGAYALICSVLLIKKLFDKYTHNKKSKFNNKYVNNYNII